MNFWKPFRYRLEYIGLVTAAWIIQRLPWRYLRPLGRSVGSLFFLADRHRREVTLANLKAAFGNEYDDKTLRSIGQKSYGVFATTVLELLWSPNLTRIKIDKIAHVEETALNPLHRAAGVPVIYFCLHAGNFEWLGQVIAHYVSPLPVIAQKLKNPLLGPLFDHWRSTFGQRVIPQERAMLKTLRHLKAGGKLGVLIDLNLKPHEGPVVIRCFDRLLVPVTRLPAELALRTGAALVPIECISRPEGGYCFRYLPAISVNAESTVESLAQACWDALEPGVRKHPEMWLWSYKHWRYRPSTGETDHYPFYANQLDSFDALLSEQLKKSCENKIPS